MQKTWDVITWIRSNRFMVEQAYTIVSEAQRLCQVDPEARDKDERAIAEIAEPKLRELFAARHPDPGVDWTLVAVHVLRDFRNSDGLPEAVICNQ